MITRREKLLRLCEFQTPHEDIYYSLPIEFWQATQEENARLLPILTALIDENEKLREALENIYDDSDPKFEFYCETIDHAKEIAKKALTTSPLDALLQGDK